MAETGVESPGGPVAFFDGVCNLCDGVVNFLIDHDPWAVLKFAPLQGTTFAALAEAHPELAGIDSFVLWSGPRVFTRSAAALHIAMALGWPWRALGVLLALPRPLRDAAYDFVARRRYRWYGRRESCRMPTPALRARFLD